MPLFGGDADLYRKLGSPDVCIHLAWRDGFRHNSAAHMKDLSSHVTFLNTLIDGGLKDLSVMGTMHEVGYWEGAINESTPCKPQSQYGHCKNALRQSMMLTLADSPCKLHWLRAYYITGERRTAARSLPRSPRPSRTAKRLSRSRAAATSMTSSTWTNWPT